MIECVLNCSVHKQGNNCKIREKNFDTNMYQKSVETSQVGKVTALRNEQVQTDRTDPNNKPDIITRDNEKEPRVSGDDAISGDRTVIVTAAEKILEYTDLTIEIQRMWNVKMKVIPVITGETGTISKSFIKH